MVVADPKNPENEESNQTVQVYKKIFDKITDNS